MREGERYADTVPDTLDLVERGELALHGMCNTVDPDNEALMYFEVHFCHRPPLMRHRGCDFDCTPKFAEAITEMRVMCGSDKYTDIETQMLDFLVSCISPDDRLILPCFHFRTGMLPISGKLGELLASEEVKNERLNEGRHSFCEGCTVYCYMRASLFRKVDRYFLPTLLSAAKYAYEYYRTQSPAKSI